MIVAIISDKTVMLFIAQKTVPLPLLSSVRNFMISPLFLPRRFDVREGNYTDGQAQNFNLDFGNFSVELMRLTARYADHRTLLSQQPGKRERR